MSLQQEFYNIDKLAEGIAGSAFVSLDHVPDHRLRPMIHILICFFLFSIWFGQLLFPFSSMLQFSDAHRPARPDIIKTELKLYVNFTFPWQVYVCFWGSWYCLVPRSTMKVYSALCWDHCSATCCRSGSPHPLFSSFKLFSLKCAKYHGCVSYYCFRDSTWGGRSSTSGHLSSKFWHSVCDQMNFQSIRQK